MRQAWPKPVGHGKRFVRRRWDVAVTGLATDSRRVKSDRTIRRRDATIVRCTMMAGMRHGTGIKYFHAFGIFKKEITLRLNRPSLSAPHGGIQIRTVELGVGKKAQGLGLGAGVEAQAHLVKYARDAASAGTIRVWLTLTSRGTERICNEGW
jgi:hypothetical protein